MVLVVSAIQVGAVAAAEAQRLGRMIGAFNVVRLLPPAAGTIAMVLLAATGERGPSIWLLVIATAQTVVLVAALVWVTQPVRLRPSSRASVRKSLAATARLGPGNWVTLLQYRGDLLAVALIFPPSVVGFYSVGVAAQTAVAAAGQAGGQHWFSMGRDAWDSGTASLRREVLRTGGLATVAAVLVGGTSYWWVGSLFGSDFAAAVPLAVGMSLVAVVQSVDYLFAHALLLAGSGVKAWLYRLPAVSVLVVGVVTVSAAELGPSVVVAVAGVGYVVSVVVMAVVLRGRRKAAVSRTQSPQPVTSPMTCRRRRGRAMTSQTNQMEATTRRSRRASIRRLMSGGSWPTRL
jgi:hypothetical protein